MAALCFELFVPEDERRMKVACLGKGPHEEHAAQ